MAKTKTTEIIIVVDDIKVCKEENELTLKLIGKSEGGLEVEVDVPRVKDKFKITTRSCYEEIRPGVDIVTSEEFKLEIPILMSNEGVIYSVKDKKRERLIRSLDEFVELGFITEASKECIIDKCKNNDDLKKSIESLGDIFIKID